jgi:hypothetical protein
VLQKLKLEIKRLLLLPRLYFFFRILLLNIIERSCKSQRIHLCLGAYKISSNVDCALFCAVVFVLIKYVYYSLCYFLMMLVSSNWSKHGCHRRRV